MYYVLDKIGDGYKVISHHDKLTQADIDKHDSSGFFKIEKFKSNRWTEMWIENNNRVIAIFDDTIEHSKINHPMVSNTHDELERAVREYKIPFVRNKKLNELGI